MKRNASHKTERDRPFTPEEDAILRELHAAGVSTAQIGLRLGRTKNSVIGRASRLGCAKRSSPIKSLTYVRVSTTPEQEDEIIALRRQGMSVTAITRKTGLSQAIVYRICPASEFKVPRAKAAPKPVERKPMVVALPPPPPAPVVVVPLPPPRTVSVPTPRPATGEGCRMPLWGHQDRPTHFYCGAPRVGSTSWCAACLQVVSVRAAARDEAA